MKIKLESDDDLPLGKILNIPLCVITARSIFQKTTTTIHKFIYIDVFMNINMKIIFIPLYK